MLTSGMRHLWPGAYKPRTAKDRAVHTAKDLIVGTPHLVANAEGSDRYTLSLPGSIENRMSPLECPVANMTIAGDWTACGLDVGCVEAAVMSGMLAAHAITGNAPTIESIIGYDHP
jgi:predicted NAD/FAD-dependent oxidoreductase